MFRAFTMESVNGYNLLSDTHKNMFDETYKKHLSSMDLVERRRYSENNVIKIEAEISVLRVYFNHGESFIYMHDHKWVKIP